MFNPNDYLINLQGKKYLQVAHRVLWFKTENPTNGAITTELVQIEPFPVVKAFVSIDGAIVATAYGTAMPKEKSVYKGREIEKAETAAIGRALANAGYGTQFSEMVDDDKDHLSDSPEETRKNAPTSPVAQSNSNGAPTHSDTPQNKPQIVSKQTARDKYVALLKERGVNLADAMNKRRPPNNVNSDIDNHNWYTLVLQDCGLSEATG